MKIEKLYKEQNEPFKIKIGWKIEKNDVFYSPYFK